MLRTTKKQLIADVIVFNITVNHTAQGWLLCYVGWWSCSTRRRLKEMERKREKERERDRERERRRNRFRVVLDAINRTITTLVSRPFVLDDHKPLRVVILLAGPHLSFVSCSLLSHQVFTSPPRFHIRTHVCTSIRIYISIYVCICVF